MERPEPVRDFRDLLVWQKAMLFAKQVYQLTRQFPKEEIFVLTAQVRRAAISVPSNIAEGHSRQGREYLHYLSIARGSLAEAETQLLLAVSLGYLKSEELEEVRSITTEIRKMCAAITQKLRSRPNP